MPNLMFSCTFANPDPAPGTGGDTQPGSGGVPGNLTLPDPETTVWNFDETAITTWDSDVSADSVGALNGAIQAAMGQGSTGHPQFHRIMWTGGNLSGNLPLQVSAGLPDKYGPHILIDGAGGAGPTVISGELQIGDGLSNVKFTGFRIQPASSNFSSGLRRCIAPQGVGNGRRLAFSRCQMGAYWRSGGPDTYPEVWGTGAARGWEISVEQCEIRSVYQVMDCRSGYHDLRHNLVTGLIDDFVAMSTRNQAPYLCHAYLVGNVILDFTDRASDVGHHCDFVQTGVPADGSNDEYNIQAYGNIYIGDTYRQYPTMAGIIQREGQSRRHELQWHDNIFLNTGTRGWWLPDRRVDMDRNFMGWPPLGGAVPTTGTGWHGGPYRQHIRSSGNLGPAGAHSFGHYVAAQNPDDRGNWGNIPNPAFILNHTAGLGGPTSYDTVCPNMTGLRYEGATLIIDNGFAAVPRNAQAIRDWVSNTYEPATPAQGQGWSENGFNDPAGWFV